MLYNITGYWVIQGATQIELIVLLVQLVQGQQNLNTLLVLFWAEMIPNWYTVMVIRLSVVLLTVQLTVLFCIPVLFIYPLLLASPAWHFFSLILTAFDRSVLCCPMYVFSLLLFYCSLHPVVCRYFPSCFLTSVGIFVV